MSCFCKVQVEKMNTKPDMYIYIGLGTEVKIKDVDLENGSIKVTEIAGIDEILGNDRRIQNIHRLRP